MFDYFSLTTIVKISKNAGSLLKPHVPLLVVALLESLSTLEPQMLNYLSLHVAGSTATQEKVNLNRNVQFSFEYMNTPRGKVLSSKQVVQ